MSSLKDALAPLIQGDAVDDVETLNKYNHDTSIFTRTPKVVVFPKSVDDVQAVVKYTNAAKARGEDVSIAPRAAGTDMTGGPLTHSVAMVFPKYLNKILEIGQDFVRAEPGAYYRDVEKATLAKTGKLIPSFPASRLYCAIGGMVANDSGGELTLRYGKTNRYVRELEVVLSDGSVATMGPISFVELEEKKKLPTLEGDIYRKMHSLILEHRNEIEASRPTVTKNSAGYELWDVFDETKQIFDLTKVIVGSQGTLGIITKAKIGLERIKEHRSMLVVFLTDFEILPEIVRRVLKIGPESFESYDNHTFRLAVRFMPQMLGQLGLINAIKLGFAFIPEMWMVLTGGVPKLVLLAEFAEDTEQEAFEKAEAARHALHGLPVKTKIARTESDAAKYWTVRRESFNLLRKNVRGLYAAPFIDDTVVHPDNYPQFIPELNALLTEYHLLYTIAGHIGDANFHIIPLLDMSKPEVRKQIIELQPRVYEIVAKYKGSITGEHNDGIIRTPYLNIMYGEKMCEVFAHVKQIFDPLNILNPGKKVGGTEADIERDMITVVPEARPL